MDRGITQGKAEHSWGRRWWQLWDAKQGQGPAQLLHEHRPSTLPRDLPGKREVKQAAPGFRELRAGMGNIHKGMGLCVGGMAGQSQAWPSLAASKGWGWAASGAMRGDWDGGGCEARDHGGCKGRKAEGKGLWETRGL